MTQVIPTHCARRQSRRGPVSLLTAACLLAAACSAWPATVLYGIVDSGLRVRDTTPAGGNVNLEIMAGHRSQSRWGVRGSEDLSGGSAAVFALEGGFDLATGMPGQGGRLLGRQAYVGLKGSMGTLVLGRFALPGSGTGDFDWFAGIDPFATGFSGVGLQNCFSVATGMRVDQGLLWQSGMWTGWRFGLVRSFHIDNLRYAPPAPRIGMTGVAARYQEGPVYGVLTFDRFDPLPGHPAQTNLQMGMTYDFGAIRLHAAYALEKHQFLGGAVGAGQGADAVAAMLGATLRLAGGHLLLARQVRDGKALGSYEADRRVWSLGYEYPWSRRTLLYFSLARSSAHRSLAADPDYNYRQAAFGLRHQF